MREEIMVDFSIYSLGCRVNQIEGQEIGDRLLEMGFSVSYKIENAKNYIINSCSVTNTAHAKSKNALSRALRQNKMAKAFVVGCSVGFCKEDFTLENRVVYISDAKNKENTLAEILNIAKKEVNSKADAEISSIAKKKRSNRAEKSVPNKKTRAHIKIQDGCDKFCTYCIVPYLRGKSRSKPIEECVAKVKSAVANGAKEIVLSGICISDYKPSLIALMQALSKIDVRKRFGSLSMQAITDEFLQAHKEANFCEHFHLSLQSGSDSVLSRMGRSYNFTEMTHTISKIRKFYPNCRIMSDIITGFPMETELEFQDTVKLLGLLDGAHIFPYSQRKGTAAANFNQVPQAVKNERAKTLQVISKERERAFLASQTGKSAEVLIEKNLEGYSRNYTKVYTSLKGQNEIAMVKLDSIYKDGLKGV